LARKSFSSILSYTPGTVTLTNEARGSDKPGTVGDSGAELPSNHLAAVAEARAKEIVREIVEQTPPE